MLYIWLLIISGVILVPIISGTTKELESKLLEMDDKSDDGIKILMFTIKDKEDIKTIIKVLTYFLITLFTIIVVMMVKFTSNIISDS